MKYTTKTEYGLMCLIYMAKNVSLLPVTIRQISGAENYSQSYIEKIVQHLRDAGIVKAVHGNQGGYTLARPAETITFREVIEALEGQTFQVFCEPRARDHIVCTHFSACGVKPVWQKTKKALDDLYDSITLSELAAPANHTA